MWYIHKHEVRKEYGGPEEGGWWFDAGKPVKDWTPLAFYDEDNAYEACRRLNDDEHKRRKEEEDYEYTSVLAYMSTHYSYSVEEELEMKSYPEVRPHYE